METWLLLIILVTSGASVVPIGTGTIIGAGVSRRVILVVSSVTFSYNKMALNIGTDLLKKELLNEK